MTISPKQDEPEIKTRDAFSAQRAYEAVRTQILDGSLKSGDHLREEVLAEQTGTSRTPVREALRRLALEGLVTVAQNRRSYVAQFSPREADVVFEMRARLESYAAWLAATRISETEIERLSEVATAIEAIGPEVSRHALMEFTELNNQFHRLIAEASGSRQLMASVSSIIAIPLTLLKHFRFDETVNISRSNIHHRELIEALKAGNSDWASACMTTHINSTRPVVKEGRGG